MLKRRSHKVISVPNFNSVQRVENVILKYTGMTASVWKSGPVRSFGLKLQDRDRDRSTFILEPKKTGLNRCGPVFCGLLQSWTGLGLNRS